MNDIPELDIVHHPHPLPSGKYVSPKSVLEQICCKFYPYLMKNIITISKEKPFFQSIVYKIHKVIIQIFEISYKNIIALALNASFALPFVLTICAKLIKDVIQEQLINEILELNTVFGKWLGGFFLWIIFLRSSILRINRKLHPSGLNKMTHN